jgi:diaminopimelate decarboxylase
MIGVGYARKLAKQIYLSAIHKTVEKERNNLHAGQFSLAPHWWDLSYNDTKHLQIQGCDINELTRLYGTPLYVIDKQRLLANYNNFYNSFQTYYPNIIVGYSYKTNPLPGVLSILHAAGAHAEVISDFELWLALKLGVSPKNIIFNGPSKTAKSLERAVSNQIMIINIDGFAEIDIIDQLARNHSHIQQVGVRLVTSVGWSSQFGLNIKNGSAFEAFKRLRTKNHVKPCGLHLHLGTGLKDINTYLQAIKEVLDFAKILKAQLDIDIKYFDFGGGFGVPTVRPLTVTDTRMIANGLPIATFDPAQSPKLREYSEKITALFTQYYDKKSSEAPWIIFEPGRAITSSSQSLLLSVLAIKDGANNIKTVILDGGKNITMPLAYEYHEIFPATKMGLNTSEFYNLYGPLCHPSDIIFLMKKLPKLEVGDVLAVMDAGAYFVPNQMNFSNPRPPAIMVDSGQHELIRKRESFDNIVSLDFFKD